MNDRLIGEFLTWAAQAPAGQRGHILVAIVAEHCATICDALDDPTVKDGLQAPSETIRAAFTPRPKPTATALAAAESVRQ